jgi:hypothetical protein
MSDASQGDARVFDVETRYQQMAKRPGGVPREKAIQEAISSIESKKSTFDDFVHKEMQGLASAIDTARSGTPAAKWAGKANLHSSAMRDVGTTMGAELLTCVADSFCEVLDAIEDGAAYDLDTLACHFDSMMLVRQPEYRGVRPDQVPELIRGLRRLAERISAHAAPSVVPES